MLRNVLFGTLFCAAISAGAAQGTAQSPQLGPFEADVAAKLAALADASPAARAAAADALGFLRAYAAEDGLLAALSDPSADVRRSATLALAWCGGRKSIAPLLTRLEDADWHVRQAAHVALTNLTGMEFPFDALAPPARQAAQAAAWRQWWAAVPAERPPAEVVALLEGVPRLAQGGSATASTTYKGPPDILLDGQLGPEYWQTKNVEPPQWVTVDLGREKEVGRVVVHQYGPGYCMTGYELALSSDGEQFHVVHEGRGVTPVELDIAFPPRAARFVRITSLGSENPRYPTTFFEVEIDPQIAPAPETQRLPDTADWRLERGLRALGALGGEGASQRIVDLLGPAPPTAAKWRPAVRVGIRSLGRLRDEVGREYLVGLLDNPMWARNAADALGDLGDPRAVPALLAAYERYAKRLDGSDPPDVPADDRMGFPSEDRMLETPYAVACALCRLPIDRPAHRVALARLAPLVMANLPGDFDTFMLYEPEVGHRLTRCLLDRSGRRREAMEFALSRLGQPADPAVPIDAAAWSDFPPHRIASWLPALVGESSDLVRLVALLDHADGWVRLNAAKALAWLGDPQAIPPLARRLAAAPAEATFGFSGTFKDEEFGDPSPRWREGLIRALGLLGAHQQTALITGILNDRQSVLEVRRAAADALVDLGNPDALAALAEAAVRHDFHSIRHVARDGLRRHGYDVSEPEPPAAKAEAATSANPSAPAFASLDALDAVAFIRGDNNIPNTLGTVEQADRWRQTYAVTDSGPEYRPGNNLYILRPVRPDGTVTPLTRFEAGYVASPELSWDGTHLLFTHRGKDDPWWHVWRVNLDGSDLRQLTRGPFHHVTPAYLPDGRIVFGTSRGGIRDEYHAYPCTPLWVMNADGSDMHPVATNIGRDNEPAVLLDGRVVFSRLEVFYSRNKTELTLHAVNPDGTRDVVLYGPERRRFWRNLDHGAPDPADGQEAPLTHRVLRMTQPRPMPGGRDVVVATQGGLALVGTSRTSEKIITPNNKEWAYTTPYPLADGRILCAATLKTPERTQVDLGLYLFDPASQRLEPIYNDPAWADYEPIPLAPRGSPAVRPDAAWRYAYSGRFFCSSVFETQETEVARRGRLVRLIEGVPMVARHSTQTNPNPVWQNHGGTLARVLGTAPLAADGSFYLEVPADRLLHLQVLDSDRRVMGNQLTWIYARPGEVKSCVGCHEHPHTAQSGHDPLASHGPPLEFLPKGHEFTYRAKAWFKGSLPPEIEERTRSVRAVNLLGRQ